MPDPWTPIMTEPYTPDDGAKAYAERSNAEWQRRWKIMQDMIKKEALRRHPESLEKAYQWASDAIWKIENPPSDESLYQESIPYKGTI